jgi:glycolate oxidase
MGPLADITVQLASLGLGDRLLTGPAQLAAFGSDGLTAFNERPAAVVIVESTAEVAATVRACHEAGVPFVARGSGTSLSGGSVPIAGGVVIALNRLNKVLAVDPASRTAVVQPGVINLRVSEAVAEHGLQFAPDPSSQSVCSIGGNLAFNSGGAHCLKHGMTSNHVLGMKVVLPDGEFVELGGEHLDTVGPDWTGMFCGCEGLFGIAVEVTLRLVPIPEAVSTSLAAYSTLQAAGDAVARIVREGLLPVAMEIMDSLAMEAAEAAVSPGYPECAALLIVEIDGEHDTVAADRAVLEKLLRDSGATFLETTDDPARRALIWKGRKSAFSAVGWLSPDYIVQDGVVPRTRLGEALATIDRMSEETGIRVANVFHAGDGNLHPLILYDGREQGSVDRAHALAGEILTMCIALGGSITGEHGVGVEKLKYLPLMFSSDDLQLMQDIRRAVDPMQLANRGKMLEVAG